MSGKPKGIITIDIPPTPSQDVIEWCVLHNLRRDFMKDLTIPIEVMNTLVLKMWNIEDRNPNWKTTIIPLLMPYFKRNKKIEITSADTPGQTMHIFVKI